MRIFLDDTCQKCLIWLLNWFVISPIALISRQVNVFKSNANMSLRRPWLLYPPNTNMLFEYTKLQWPLLSLGKVPLHWMSFQDWDSFFFEGFVVIILLCDYLWSEDLQLYRTNIKAKYFIWILFGSCPPAKYQNRLIPGNCTMEIEFWDGTFHFDFGPFACL